jgi:hypothetical protein
MRSVQSFMVDHFGRKTDTDVAKAQVSHHRVVPVLDRDREKTYNRMTFGVL